MSFIEQIKAKAKASKKVIVLPESEDMRTLEAADRVLKEEIAELVLLGKEEKILEDAKKGGFCPQISVYYGGFTSLDIVSAH